MTNTIDTTFIDDLTPEQRERFRAASAEVGLNTLFAARDAREQEQAAARALAVAQAALGNAQQAFDAVRARIETRAATELARYRPRLDEAQAAADAAQLAHQTALAALEVAQAAADAVRPAAPDGNAAR